MGQHSHQGAGEAPREKPQRWETGSGHGFWAGSQAAGGRPPPLSTLQADTSMKGKRPSVPLPLLHPCLEKLPSGCLRDKQKSASDTLSF